ncbi:PrpF domain-containing protein [Alkalihalobacillus sp. BA299]|uniref:PrpF domain-containing protein n=1 Tax=Alkalihalobacillus sp. BA299 TaxID=2815938 RepID=UPI001ADB7B79|nr:PrpF domain-containing protein [Alkalihalobacillus sp. BA299]
MSQYSIPCVVYRGGTSRGLFFHKKDLPIEIEKQKEIFLSGIDAWNPSQIDGLGSGTSHTSKVVVISPPSVEGADVDYTFYQIGIGEQIVDDKGTCGNLMAAVGAFAIDEGLVGVELSQDYAQVNAFNTNIGKMLRLKVPVVKSKAKVNGQYYLSGLVNPGAKLFIDILSPGGGKTGKTLPLGPETKISVKGKEYLVSFVDIVNPCVFIAAEDLGITGIEKNDDISKNESILKRLEAIRLEIAILAGMSKTKEDAMHSPSIPKIALVAKPQDYVTSSGKKIKESEVDIVAKMVSMGRFHRTFAGSGLYNLAAAVLLSRTIPNHFLQKCSSNKDSQVIRIGHPEGIVEVRVAMTKGDQDVDFVGLDRTARRIMKGVIYIPN